MRIKDTGNESLNKWKDYFSKKNKTNTRFISLLKKLDKSFLTVSPSQDIEEFEYPDDGLLEEDFREIAFRDSSDKLDEKSRLVIALYSGVNLNPWKEKYGEIFNSVIEKSLIEGNYEQYDIKFEKVLSLAVKKEYIDKDDFMGLALLRGMLIGERYTTVDEEKLKKSIRFNKIKIMLNI